MGPDPCEFTDYSEFAAVPHEALERAVADGRMMKTEDGVYIVKPFHQEAYSDATKMQMAAMAQFTKPASFDPVNRPEHYNTHPSGVECVEITEHMTCMIGCAIKYLWRHGQKAGADADQDLRKAIWCIERERQRLQKANHGK
jgi:hypothetical protein